ncbi:hypothetical protein THOM_2030 [Trachipleistophora hominis]|uniref:Uncharacterized protein n=1 Tax=Trachipleistophora hominis TaxID=72359 RepID=L7JUQ4_TRAHO|nr:hypothetical protein THOM_2030 [Trachipleistophora hominis]
MTILYSCLVNGENCLLILPLREHGNKLFENDIKINEKLRNRIYFRKLFIDVMLSYSKEQNVLHYVPYDNLKRKKLFFSSYLTKMDQHRRDNSKYLLHSAIEFTNCVFQPSFFTKDSEFIMFCILNKSYIDIEIYQCTDEELVLNFYGSFYFKDELAIEYFSYTMDSLAEKVDASQIDEMIGNVIANGEKISMSLNNERNSYCIAIPPLQH